MHSEVMKFVMHHGGVVTETEMQSFLKMNYNDLATQTEELMLAAVLDDRIVQEHNKVNFVPHFRLASIKMTQVKKSCEMGLKILKKFNSELDADMFTSEIIKNMKEDFLHFSPSTVASSLLLDRRIVLKSGRYSLDTWRHINPRTLYDKIVYILNDISEPMHFLDIVNSIKITWL